MKSSGAGATGEPGASTSVPSFSATKLEIVPALSFATNTSFLRVARPSGPSPAVNGDAASCVSEPSLSASQPKIPSASNDAAYTNTRFPLCTTPVPRKLVAAPGANGEPGTSVSVPSLLTVQPLTPVSPPAYSVFRFEEYAMVWQCPPQFPEIGSSTSGNGDPGIVDKSPCLVISNPQIPPPICRSCTYTNLRASAADGTSSAAVIVTAAAIPIHFRLMPPAFPSRRRVAGQPTR